MNSKNDILIKVIGKVKKWIPILLTCLLFSCQSDNDRPRDGDSIHGFWLAEDKGYLIEVNDDKNIWYGINTVGCTIIDDNFIPETLGLNLELVNSDFLIARSLLSSDIILRRLMDQNEFCLSDQIANTNDPKINFDYFWNTFNDYYAFFETRNVDWSQYKNLREEVNSENFYDILQSIVFELEDGHVTIFDEANTISIDAGLPNLLKRLNTSLSGDLTITSREGYEKLYNQQIQTIASKYLNGVFETNSNQNIAWGVIDNTVGYINVFRMAGYDNDPQNELQALNVVLDRIMNDIKGSGVSKLIIDVRFNEGGYDPVSLDIASRFIHQEKFAFSKKARLGNGFTENRSTSINPKGEFQFTKDIVLLTSPITASAAEVLTLCLKDLPYVTIVGDNTNGIFSDVLTHTLPNRAQIGLSNEIYSDINGNVFEAVGIGPNEENRVPVFSNRDYEEGKDSGLDRALKILNRS